MVIKSVPDKKNVALYLSLEQSGVLSVPDKNVALYLSLEQSDYFICS